MVSKEYFKDYYLRNIEKAKAYRKERYLKHREEAIKKANEWRKANPEKAKLHSQIGRRKMPNHIIRLWCAMNRRIKFQPSYKNRKVAFSKEWFKEFCLNNKSYKNLFADWEKSGFQRALVPTIDRIDNSKDYSKDNIQFLIFKDNSHKKYYDNRKLKFRSRSTNCE